jgi:Methyltransferase domain
MNRIITLLILTIGTYTIANEVTLDQIALKYKTDKSSLGHNYTEVYAQYFNDLRYQPIRLLEIGFYHGSSAYTFEEYFPKASLYFIDIDPTVFENFGQQLSNRSQCSTVDQSDSNKLIAWAQNQKEKFTIIIDDGSHKMADQINTFEALFPFVSSNGFYIIEDLHAAYWKEYGSQGSLTAPQANATSSIRFFQALIDDINYVGARTGCADFNKINYTLRNSLNYYQKHIKAIHFYGSLCIIIKR